MFFIDIAVPRDVDPRMNEVEGCFVYDIDDLQQVAAANLADRSREAAAAETIVSREVDKYQRAPPVPRRRPRHHGPSAASRSNSARPNLPAPNRNSPTLTPEQREAVDALTRALTAKLLHPQLTALRESTRAKDEE